MQRLGEVDSMRACITSLEDNVRKRLPLLANRGG